MTITEFQQLVENQMEGQYLEFKQDVAWEKKTMAKDILAMANVKNGGSIVIGFRESEQAFEATGVSESNLQSYNREQMLDQMANYADPSVSFDLFFPEDIERKKYVVIKVHPFIDVPVLCKIDFGDLRKGTIYYRNRNGRPASSPVSNTADLREILDTAVVRLMRQRQAFGYTAAILEDTNVFKLDHLPETDLLLKIKTKGYWEIEFIPLKDGLVEPQSELKRIVEKSQSRLGWSFPDIPRDNVHPCIDGYEAESEYGARMEFWRIFQSERFHYYGALIEDWLEGDALRGSMSNEVKELKHIFVHTSVIQFLTQVFLFLEGLAKNGLYEHGLTASMTLHHTALRELYIDKYNRGEFLWKRITKSPYITLSTTLTQLQATNDAMIISNQFIRKFFASFDFDQTEEAIRAQQEKFLQGY